MGFLYAVSASDQVFVGEDKTLRIPVTDNTGVVVNITGWTLQWKLEDSQGGNVLLTKAGAVSDGPNGIATVTVAAADWSALAGGNYWHALSRTDSGFNGVIADGPFLLQPR